MLIVEIKDGINIDRALKILKNKFIKTKLMKELKERQAFVKKSVKKREVIKKAKYIQSLKVQNED